MQEDLNKWREASMSTFPNWQSHAVHQRRPLSGCIPTGYEFLLRVAGVDYVNFDTFQDDFDLDKDLISSGNSRNNFESVAHIINLRYPKICFKRIIFPRGQGAEKLLFIQNYVDNQKPILISLNMGPVLRIPGCHIMPVIEIDDENLSLLYNVTEKRISEVLQLKRSDVISIHDNYNGGDDVAFLEEITQP